MTYTTHPLGAIEIPLVNKFYAAHNARGKAKSHEQVWVTRHKQIIAAARIQAVDQVSLLVGVMVAPEYRRQGVAKQLISTLLQAQTMPVYTFAYQHLCSWYQQLGFMQYHESQVESSIAHKFLTYQQQGRNISLMRYGH